MPPVPYWPASQTREDSRKSSTLSHTIFLGLSIWGLQRSRAVHGHSWPLLLAVLSSGVVFATVWFSHPLVLLGLLGLVVASAWAIALHQTCPAPVRGPGTAPG